MSAVSARVGPPPEVVPRPFRGSTAVAAGRTTWGILRGPGHERLLPDVYVEAGHRLDARHHAIAAAVWGGPDAVVAGWAACALWDLDVAPAGVPTDLVVAGTRRSPGGAVVVHGDRLAPEDVRRRHDVAVTSPIRTAYDLARWYDLADALVGADALARSCGSTRADLHALARLHPGARGVRGVATVADLMDAGAASPPETRMRLALVRAGLPRPVTQYPVRRRNGRYYTLDLAWPEASVAVEYDGEEHRSITRHGLDLDRDAELDALGWVVVRVTARQLHDPAAVVARVARSLTARAR